MIVPCVKFIPTKSGLYLSKAISPTIIFKFLSRFKFVANLSTESRIINLSLF